LFSVLRGVYFGCGTADEGDAASPGWDVQTALGTYIPVVNCAEDGEDVVAVWTVEEGAHVGNAQEAAGADAVKEGVFTVFMRVKAGQKAFGVGLVYEVEVGDFGEEFQLGGFAVSGWAYDEKPGGRIAKVFEFEEMSGSNGHYSMKSFEVRFKEKVREKFFYKRPIEHKNQPKVHYEG
jgi:hypothetical protein